MQTKQEKSLSALCKRFLEDLPLNPDSTQDELIISLDETAKKLNVLKRRIYDIVNVLESVEVISKKNKNKYQWHGLIQLPEFLTRLKTFSIKSDFLKYVKHLMASNLDDHSNDRLYYKNELINQEDVKPLQDVSGNIANKCTLITKDMNSIGVMSQKFLMLILSSENGIISIDFAAEVLLGGMNNDKTESGNLKTKIRRLYDIINILTNINLIEKYYGSKAVSDRNTHKTLYRYIGPVVGVNYAADSINDLLNIKINHGKSKHSLFDHLLRNLTSQSQIPKFDLTTGILKAIDYSILAVENSSEVSISTNSNSLHLQPFADYQNQMRLPTQPSLDHQIRQDQNQCNYCTNYNNYYCYHQNHHRSYSNISVDASYYPTNSNYYSSNSTFYDYNYSDSYLPYSSFNQVYYDSNYIPYQNDTQPIHSAYNFYNSY